MINPFQGLKLHKKIKNTISFVPLSPDDNNLALSAPGMKEKTVGIKLLHAKPTCHGFVPVPVVVRDNKNTDKINPVLFVQGFHVHNLICSLFPRRNC